MKLFEKTFTVQDYDLTATLTSGQAFRWRKIGDSWTGVVNNCWVNLERTSDGILARKTAPGDDWEWITHYLQIGADLNAIIAGFPNDDAMRSAVTACRGLRLLRQDPWECLASFILSSTKQIVQIQQIVGLLCERFGDPLAVPPGHLPVFGFPSAAKLAGLTEADLRDCKMGFRAPYLLETARAVSEKRIVLSTLANLPVADAREQFVSLPGVGPKIADCVLLFAYGFPSAFPVDVWVMKALRGLYFPRRKPSRLRLQRFTQTYFGAHAGYAQQYLFHYMRLHRTRILASAAA